MKVLVIGAALSGIGVSKLLRRKGADVTLTDAKPIAEKEALQELGIKVFDGGHPDHLKNTSWDYIVKNPGIPYHVPFVSYFVAKNIPIFNEIEIASRYAPHFVYGAITGTNGKTTTTTLLGELLKKKDAVHSFAAGNIGLPLSEIVLEHGEESCAVALEMAAFQLLGCQRFHPSVSVCMNLTPDHLDYFGSLDRYYEAKMLVYKNQREDDWFLLNLDDPEIVRRAVDVPCRVVSFSLEKPADLCVQDKTVTLFGKPLFELADLKLVGRHNLQNAMAASAMAYKMGVAAEQIREGIQEFQGVAHRIEFVRELHGVRYYNDSKGTNVDATVVALKAFDRPVILLAGGYDKKTGFEGLRPYLNKIKRMFVYGETRDQLKALKEDAVVCETMEEALDQAMAFSQAGDVVLLSPVCASWDQFDNYEQRGDCFKELVRAKE